MSDKFFDFFYLILPGGVLFISELYIFKDQVINNKITELILRQSNQTLLLIVLVIFSGSIGLIIEGISKLIFNGFRRDQKKKIYQINRYLFFNNKRMLSEYFSSRSAFFRHMALVFAVLGISLVVKIDKQTGFVIAALIIFALFCVKAFAHYSEKETETLEDYLEHDNLPGWKEYKKDK